jgi:hypothetical protein
MHLNHIFLPCLTFQSCIKFFIRWKERNKFSSFSGIQWWASIAILICTSSISSADLQRHTDQFIWNEPPAGFEDLSGPQSALIDVYFNQRQIDSTPANFGPGWLKFEAIPELVAKMPETKDRERIIDALSGELETNAALICRDPPQPKCGQLSPGVAAVIFDKDRFRADLFVNPVLLPNFHKKGARYLPEPDAGISGLQSIAAAFTGGSSNDSAYNLRSFSLAGWDRQRLRSELTASNENGFGFNELSAEMNQVDQIYRGGLYRTAIVPILGDRPFYGISMASSYETRLDLDQIRGSPLLVFLARPSKVDIFRDGRLLSTNSYGAGNQLLNTETLPTGSYEVIIRIREAGGVMREERRFFTKTQQVPPSNAPRYVLELGVLGSNDPDPFPKADPEPVLHGGTTHRLFDQFALGVDAAVTLEEATLQADFFYINEFATVSVGAYGATDGSWGAIFSAYGNSNGLFYGLSARRILSRSEPRNDKVALTNIDTGSFTQMNFNSGYSFAGGRRISVRGFWRNDDLAGSVYSIGPNVLWPLYHSRSMRLDFVGNAAFSNEETQIMSRLRFFFDSQPYQLDADAGYQHAFQNERASDNGLLARVDGQWIADDFLGGELEIGGGVEVDPRGDLARASTRYTSLRGQVSSFVTQDVGDSYDTRFGGELFANFLGNDGELTFGGANFFPSGIIVVVDGGTPAKFEVLVNGQPKGEISTGETIPILLPEYKSYRVRLRPIGAPAVYFDSKTRVFSLYPATVKTLRWHVDAVVTIIGRIVDANGNPVADARLDGGVETAYTDSNGYFQADVSSKRTLQVTRDDRTKCNVTLGPISHDEVYASVGNLLCR